MINSWIIKLNDYSDSNTFCKVKRQTGTAAVVLIGTSNPPIVAAEVNPIGDTTPLIGTGLYFLLPSQRNEELIEF